MFGCYGVGFGCGMLRVVVCSFVLALCLFCGWVAGFAWLFAD